MLEKAKNGIEKTIKHLSAEYSKLQLGRANPELFEGINVEVYGVIGPLKNNASVSVMDPQTINIKPWDKSIIHNIEKAINDSGIGLSPQNMGESIIIKIPSLTEERRTQIAKLAKKLSEEAKVGIRNARADSHKDIKKALEEKAISEDQEKKLQTELQTIVDEANKKIEDYYKQKEADIMKV